MAKRVDQIMTRKLATVEMDDTLKEVNAIFTHSRFHHLLVVASGRLVGVISDRDLFKAISPNIGTLAETNKDLATLNKKVHQIMSRKPIALREDAVLHDAVDVFLAHGVSCIPVTNAEDHPVGIVTWRDLIKELNLPR